MNLFSYFNLKDGISFMNFWRMLFLELKKKNMSYVLKLKLVGLYKVNKIVHALYSPVQNKKTKLKIKKTELRG